MNASQRTLLPSFVFVLCVTPLPGLAQTVVDTVAVGARPAGVAVNSVTNKIYVTGGGFSGGFNVTVIDGATDATSTVPIDRELVYVAVNPVTNKIYVPHVDNGTTLAGSVTVIDGVTNNTATVSAGDAPGPLAVNSATNKIYVGVCNDDQCSRGAVTVIDGLTLATQSVAAGYAGGGPPQLAVNAVTNKIYVINSCGNDPSCQSNGTVTVIDGTTLSTTTVPTDMLPGSVAVNSVTNKIYVTNACADFTCINGSVTVIDGSNNSTARVPVGYQPTRVAINPVTNKIYVSDSDNTVTVIDGATNDTVTIDLSGSGAFTQIAVDSATNKIYLPIGSNLVTMIDGATNSTTTVVVGNIPDGLAVNSATNRIYVANSQDNTVSVIAGAAAPAQFVAVTPCRLVDTRPENGGNGPIQGGTAQSFTLPQLGNCNIPATAAAYSLNVTVVPPGRLGFLTIWPTGVTRPQVSLMNSLDGRIKANATIVPAGINGAVNVYVNNTSNAEEAGPKPLPVPRERARALGLLPTDGSLGEWRIIGPQNYAGKAYDVAVDPTDPNTVYAAFGSGGGLWKTSDGGNSWVQLTDRSDVTDVACVTVHPSMPNVVAACVGAPGNPSARRGLMYSSDGGNHFDFIGPDDGLSTSFYRAIFDPRSQDVIYAASPWGVYLTTDRGAHWNKILTFPGQNQDWFDDWPDLVMKPDNPMVLIAAQKNLGVFRTADGGMTWSEVDQAMDRSTETTVLAWSASDPRTVYCERNNTDGQHMLTYVSSDAGVTWTQAGDLAIYHQGRYDMALTVDPTNSLHVLTFNGSAGISGDGLRTFHYPQQSPHVDHLGIAFARSAPSVVYDANDGGIWRSSDGGETWTRFDSGVNTNIVNTNLSFGFDVDPASGNIYLSAGDYGAIRYTTAQGWFPSSYGGEWAEFYIDPSDSHTVWYASYSDLAVSHDAGQTWRSVNPTDMGYRGYRTVLRFDPNRSGHLFFLSGDIWVSHDSGSTWQDTGVGSASGVLTDMIADPSQPGAFYVSENGGILSSSDGGVTWVEHHSYTGGLPYYCGVMAPVPGQAGKFYLSAEGGLYLVSNGGQSAQPLPGNELNGLSISDLKTDPAHPERIYAGTSDGFFISEDYGQSWQRLGRNLPAIGVSDILVKGSAIYAATYQGIWRFSADVSWQQPAPTDLRATPTSNSSIALTWTPGNGSSGVRLYRAGVQTYVGFDHGYSDQGLTAGTNYCYTVLDTNISGEGPLSAPVCASTSALLTVNKTGSGTVTSSDGFITCGSTCSHNYNGGTQVNLTATGDPGWDFRGWSGACAGLRGCEFIMNQNQSVTANFSLRQYNMLTVSVSGSGSVSTTDGLIHCPGTCSHIYNRGTMVTLNASPTSGWIFSGWSGACSGVGPCNISMTNNLGVSAYFLQPGHGLQFSSVAPCRLIDTRETNTPIAGGSTQNFGIPQLGNCNIPATAAFYSLNVTVVPHGRLGYLTVWPAGQARPNTSLMNSLDGRTKANAAMIMSGTNNTIRIFASDTTDVVLDIEGYFTTPDNSTLEFYPMTPCRVVDTRSTDGPLAGPSLLANQERDFPVSTSPCIPSGVSPAAYSFNVTAVPNPDGQRLGFLSVWPQGQDRPTVSTLNNLTGTIVANAAIVPAGMNGGIAVYPNNTTDLLIDINGYFTAPGTGGLSLYPAPPCRVLDTRGDGGNGQPFTGEKTVNVTGSPCAPPSNAQAYVFNATVVPPSRLGFLTLWPDGDDRPTASTLNATDGAITSNMAIVPSSDGSIDAYANDLTQLILDISSYFAP